MYTIFGGKTQISDGGYSTGEVRHKFHAGDFFAQSARFARNLIVELRFRI
jgi:hypothetical protein